MGGGDGIIIVSDAAQRVLSAPEVHGRLPATITSSLDPILKREDPLSWSDGERDIVGNAYYWALRHLHTHGG